VGVASFPLICTVNSRYGTRATKGVLLLLLLVKLSYPTERNIPSPVAFIGGIGYPEIQIHDDQDQILRYSGSWTTNNYPWRYRGTSKISKIANDTVSLTFRGSQIAFIYARQANTGIFQVWIDNKPAGGPIDSYSPYMLAEQVAAYSGLEDTIHTISIQVSGKQNPKSTGSWIVVDALIVGKAAHNVHDDSDSTLAYSGQWLSSSAPNSYMGTRTYSNIVGASMAFSFTGTSVTLLCGRQSNAGIAHVAIDGSAIDDLDEYSPVDVGVQLVTYSGFASGQHSLTVTVSGQANKESLGSYVVIDGVIANATYISNLIDGSDPIIRYEGVWGAVNKFNYGVLGTLAASNHAGDSATVRFTGDSVAYIFSRGNNLGVAQVLIDDVLVGTIDEFYTIDLGQQIAVYGGLSKGEHTITVIVSGDRASSSNGSYVTIDAFIAQGKRYQWPHSDLTGAGRSIPSANGRESSWLGSGPRHTLPPQSTPASPQSTYQPSEPGYKHFDPIRSNHGGIPGWDTVVWPKGNCASDDTAALQSLLDTGRHIDLDWPIGGCYLISKTLILRPGNHLVGRSANNPNPQDYSHGVIIRLAANSNVPILKTQFSDDPPGGGNEYMSVENIVFDGNGSAQTAELAGALVDFRGTFIQTYLRHVMITRTLGVALFTGSTELDNVWIIGTTTSSAAWINNPYQTGLGGLLANQVYVEETMKPAGGGYRDPFSGNSVNDPSAFQRAIWFNGVGNATINQLHCESASVCLDINDVQALTIHGISGNRIGNPSSPDPTDQYLIRARNSNIYSLNFTSAYLDQSGSILPASAYRNTRVFGCAGGVRCTDLYETPVGKTVWPLYTWGRYDQGESGVPYLGERPIVTNELWIEQTGGYSPSKISLFDSQGGPDGSYAFFEREGNRINLGLSPGPWNSNEVSLLRLNFFGTDSNANNVEVPGGRIQTGIADNTDLVGEVQFDSAAAVDYKFFGYYQVHPECTIEPQFDQGDGNGHWVTYNGASTFTIHFRKAVTGLVSYICVGRN
jgi:hypothetical protein